jgi:hypothetical protein
MAKTVTRYTAKFTNGESREILAYSDSGAREAAYSWLCAYRPHNVYILKLMKNPA